jgi:hypothetical protein
VKYFLDTEFYEDGKTIDLISIGLVCEDGRELYAINRDAQLHRVSDWVRKNVLSQLPAFRNPAWCSRQEIADAVRTFASGTPEFWAYYADYDWVVVAQLFGTMMDLPKHFPMFCMDLKQLAVMKGNPELPKQEDGEHNALADARWNRDVHAFLSAPSGRPAGEP